MDDINTLRARVASMRQLHAQAQQDAAAKTAVVHTLLEQLQTEFGCTSVEEGQQLLQQLDQKASTLTTTLTQLLAAVEQQLGGVERAGASHSGSATVRAA